MPVVRGDARHGACEPDHVYVIPPEHGRWRSPTGRPAARRRAARAAARTCRSTTSSGRWPRSSRRGAIGVVLSGTGVGRHARPVRRSRRRAASPSRRTRRRRKYAGMPQSAIAQRLRRLRPAARGDRAASWREIGAPSLPGAPADRRRAGEPTQEPASGKVLAILRAVDRRRLHPATATRRSSGASCGAWCCTRQRTLADYAERLEQRARRGRGALPRPADQRHQLLPRPASCSRRSRQSVFPEIVEGRVARRRRSASGCRAARPGEEAYSLAIALLEFLDDRPVRAADPDLRHRPQRPASLERARAGRLPGEHRGRGLAGAAAPLLHDGRRTATGSTRRSATCASSRGRTWRPTRRSRTST